MDFTRAMQLAGQGEAVQRAGMACFLVAAMTAAVTVSANGAVNLGHGVMKVTPRDAQDRTSELYYASAEDQAADDWQIYEYSPMLLEPVTLGHDANGSPTTESPTAANTNTQPEDARDPSAAPIGTQGEVQDAVSVDAPALPAAGEVAAPVQEVVHDSALAAAPGGVKEGDVAQ
jgi:hypothetical protein